MEFNPTRRHFRQDSVADTFAQFLENNQTELGFEDSQVYFEFPLYRDNEGEAIISKLLLVSPNYGVIAIGTSNATSSTQFATDLNRVESYINQVFDYLYSRLIRNTELKKDRVSLKFPCSVIIYAPFVDSNVLSDVDTPLIFSDQQLKEYFQENRKRSLSSNIFVELQATIDGSKGLIRPRAREIDATKNNSKGYLANKLEAEIARFDHHQKLGAMSILDGPQRIRGLAGSGKTVVLALKAALTHLRFPDAKLLYTFYTRSLYQQIQRLITRFYRQFDDRDPDWSQLNIMHAWGGSSTPGVYFNACIEHGIQPITYNTALVLFLIN
jgi:superfamily I DNA and RNA helicase